MKSIEHRVKINASMHDVFSAIATVDGLKNWYVDDVKFRPDTYGELSADGEITFSFTGLEEPFCWRVAKLQPDSLIHWHCESGPGHSKGTDAIFHLSQKGDQTILDFDHNGFGASDEKFRTCNTLWASLLIRLRDYVQTGQLEPASS